MPRPTNEVTELAKERNRQAAERTLTAWIGSSLLLLEFGIVFEEIPLALQQSLPQNDVALNLRLSYLIGLGTIAAGIILLIPMAIAHTLTIQSLEQEKYLVKSGNPLYLLIVVSAVILLGLIALINLILVISQQ